MRKIKDPSKKKTTKLPLHPFEFVWYTLCGLVGIWGLTYIVLGLIAENLPIKSEDKGLVKVNLDFAKTFKLDFFGWGLIILAIAAVAIVVVLLLFSNKVDREFEKSTRRAQRLAQLEAEEAREDAEEEKKEEIVDAEVTPAEKTEEVEEVEVTEEPSNEEPKE